MIPPDDPKAIPSEADRPSDEDGGRDDDPGIRWTPFDPGDAPELPASEDGSGRVVAMIASIELVGVGWAVSVATELARVWSAERPGVVLVDTDLARPRLHHAVRVDNAIGLAEVLRGEAPVADATRTVDEDRLFCVPAGNAPEDPAQGFDATRWGRLCKAFSDAGVTVVAYVPVQAGWIEQVLDTATDVVLLAEQDRRLDWPREGAPPLRAVLGPMMPRTRAPSDPTGKERAGPPPLLGFDTPPAESEADKTDPDDVPRGVVGDERPTDHTAEGPTSLASPARRGPASGARRREQRRRAARARWLRLTGGAVLLAAVAFWAFSLRKGGADDGSAQGPAEEPAATAESLGPGASTGPRPVPPEADFSVAVASYSDPARASERAARLAASWPALPWMVALVEVEGTTYHRVLAGFAADSAAASALGAELAREGRGGITDWVVRGTGWVVDFGSHPSRAAAEDALADVRQAGIPAYVARVQHTDGSEVFSVNAGAYAGPAEATPLLERARAVGLDARITRRVGRPLT